MTRFSFTCFIGLTEGFKKEIYVYLTFSKPAYFLVSPKCCPDRPVLNAVLEACSEQRSCLSLGHTNGLSLLKSASQLSSNISEVIQTAKGRTPLIQAIKKLTRESQNIWKSKITNHESRQHVISRLLSCTCTVLTIFVVIWGAWEAVSYLLQKKSWHSQVCSSSQWNVKPWHPQHILFEAIEQTKTKLQKKRRKLRKRKWGDAGVRGEEKECENRQDELWPLSMKWIRLVKEKEFISQSLPLPQPVKVLSWHEQTHETSWAVCLSSGCAQWMYQSGDTVQKEEREE